MFSANLHQNFSVYYKPDRAIELNIFMNIYEEIIINNIKTVVAKEHYYYELM